MTSTQGRKPSIYQRPPVPPAEPEPQPVAAEPAGDGFPTKPDGLPDFAKMTAQQRLAYHRQRLAGL